MNTDIYQSISESLNRLGPCSGTIEQSAYDEIDLILNLIKENFTLPPKRTKEPDEYAKLRSVVKEYLSDTNRVEPDRILNQPETIDPRVYPIWVMRMIIHDQGGGLGYGKLDSRKLDNFMWFHKIYGGLVIDAADRS